MWSRFHSAEIRVEDFDAALEHYACLLGRSAAWLGPRADGAGRSALLPLANMTLEVSEAVAGESERTGLVGIRLALEAESGQEAANALAARGVETLGLESLSTPEAEGARARAWDRLRVDASASRGIGVEGVANETGWRAAPSKPDVPAHAAIRGLDHVVVLSADLEATRAFYLDGLGLRLALDRSFEERGVRLLFFRLAGVTVEIGGRLGEPPRSEARDRFGGLAWQVEDVDAIQQRLIGAGFDVSEVRAGHKPGTRVCTVRDPVHGVPTLLIQPVSR